MYIDRYCQVSKERPCKGRDDGLGGDGDKLRESDSLRPHIVSFGNYSYMRNAYFHTRIDSYRRRTGQVQVVDNLPVRLLPD